MDYDMNEEREQYIYQRGKIVVNACPGSGKTTSVGYKLMNLISNWDNKYSGIACLSFTNVAKDEINDKFLDFNNAPLNYPHLISTIDSFINRYITLPHFKTKYQCVGRPIILDDDSILDSLSFHKFRINNRPIHYIYPPSKIDINVDGTFLFDGNSLNLDDEDKEIFIQYCRTLKNYQFSRGVLKNSDSLYAAHQILLNNPRIATSLVKRFKYIIIDEAQDTSEIQHLIIDQLIENGLENIELIGDPYQSLYEWRNARPDLFLDKFASEAWTPLEFTRCKRSLDPIVKAYSLFRIQEHNNLVGQELRNDNEKPIHIIYFHTYDLLVTKYEEISNEHSSKNILVRGSSLLREMSGINTYIDLWKESPFSPLQIIHAKEDLQYGDIKPAINRLFNCIPLLINPNFANPKLKKDFIENNKDNYSFTAKLLLLLKSIPDFNNTLIDWTDELKETCENIFELTSSPTFTLKAGIHRPKHSKLVSELFGRPDNSTNVSTIHKAKGKTYDSILITLSPNSSGQNLSINDFIRPNEMPDEKKRLLYVAMSRPRWQLVIGIPNQSRLTEERQAELFGDCLVHEV
jgi:DNA helicase II / ATP-dependent DNA helicase PcrA